MDTLAPQERFIGEGDDEGPGFRDGHMPVHLFSRFTLEVLVIEFQVIEFQVHINIQNKRDVYFSCASPQPIPPNADGLLTALPRHPILVNTDHCIHSIHPAE